MMKKNTILRSFMLLIHLSLITGILYPLAVNLVAGTFFKEKAEGSLIYDQDQNVIGSALIGQKFIGEDHFWGRPSASQYAADGTSTTNWSPTNPLLKESVQREIKRHLSFGQKASPEMLFSSASGLDPHISPIGAINQIDRILRFKGLKLTYRSELIKMVNNNTLAPTFGFLGQARVNVTTLNRDLKQWTKKGK